MLTDALKPIARAYGGRTAWAKERSERKTQLNYEPWLIVRSSKFKARFGDWEAWRGLRRLHQVGPLNLDGLAPLADKATIKTAFQNFGEVENQFDGRKIVFPNAMAGKIERHKGFDTKRIAAAFDQLFARSVPMISELEELREKHKDHSRSVESFHHYVNQFEHSSERYYIRFTIWQKKAKEGEQAISEAHSSFISKTYAYEKGAEPDSVRFRVISPGVTEDTTPIDAKLASWLTAGKSKIYTELDVETGEPLASTVAAFLKNSGNG